MLFSLYAKTHWMQLQTELGFICKHNLTSTILLSNCMSLISNCPSGTSFFNFLSFSYLLLLIFLSFSTIHYIGLLTPRHSCGVSHFIFLLLLFSLFPLCFTLTVFFSSDVRAILYKPISSCIYRLRDNRNHPRF